jgi:hypothetical protein
VMKFLSRLVEIKILSITQVVNSGAVRLNNWATDILVSRAYGRSRSS